MEKTTITYTEASAEIEAILQRLRNEELDVDSLTREVTRATKLITLCKERLLKTEEEVNRIFE